MISFFIIILSGLSAFVVKIEYPEKFIVTAGRKRRYGIELIILPNFIYQHFRKYLCSIFIQMAYVCKKIHSPCKDRII